ncbi:MAG TPA: alpha/beta fold hydrolase [Paludibacter sp.]|nr:alpha/beta fold hydrolase [Paludibacter sp.]
MQPLSAQEITGDWNGALQVQKMQIRIIFHISKTETGYAGTMDSPDQGAKGIALSNVTFSGKQLTLQLLPLKIEYTGTMDSLGNINGNFAQGGQSLPLVLSRATVEKVVMKRPQEPVKPYPYISEEVVFENPKANITLAGTLTLPSAKGKFPTVVLVSGSGPQNRDEELMGHKPFLVLADYLTRNGIAVLRYDDRGTFASKGDFSKATSFDFATDAQAAVNFLKTHKNIDPGKIGIIGHSEGGLIAPLVADSDKNVSFIVLLAGPGLQGSEILMLQQQLIGRASGMEEKKIQQTAKINKAIFDLINRSDANAALENDLKNLLMKTMEDNPEMEIPKGMTANQLVEQQLTQINTPWVLNFIRYNPAPALQKVKCPVLALIGEKDLQVPAKENLPVIEAALKKGGNKNFMVKELPGLNHLFQECKTGAPAEYIDIEQTISPVALETMANWIKQTVK